MLSIEIVCLVATLFTVIYAWLRHTYGYWERQGIPFLKPIPLLGNAKVMLTQTKSFYVYLSDIYKDPKMSKAAAFGVYLFNKPVLVLREPELIKAVLVKDFQKFSNRGASVDPHSDPVGAKTLFFEKNPQWKEQRTKLTPMYTSAKVKQIYQLMKEIGAELEAHLSTKGQTFVAEAKDISALFTTDLISTSALGVQANSLKNPKAEFRLHSQNHVEFNLSRGIGFLIIFFFPKWASIFKAKYLRPEFAEFFRKTIIDVMTEREKSNMKRIDLIDVLVELKKELVAKKQYDDEARDTLVAHAAMFFAAGSDTSSSAMTFALYEMAKNPDMQERLRNEICEAFIADNGDLSYETLTVLPYLSMVLDETLRMYPALPALDRVHMPNNGEKPFDLRPYYDYIVPKDMSVYIPAYGLHNDPKYWPNPETFDPERFTPEDKKLHEPMAYLPFGVGPRNCIGNRIGLLQAKLGLAHILKNHCVKLCDKTPKEIEFDPLAFVLLSKEGVYLNFVNDGLYERRAYN